MRLEYIDQQEAKDSKNRGSACGSDKTGMSEKCAEEKRGLWPREVIKEWKVNPKTKKRGNYRAVKGWYESISCDEFPFNGSKQGGKGAQVACVPVGATRIPEDDQHHAWEFWDTVSYHNPNRICKTTNHDSPSHPRNRGRARKSLNGLVRQDITQ